MGHKGLAKKRTKAVRSDVGSAAENPQNRRNDPLSSGASASLTQYQIESSIALSRAIGDRAGSPFAAQKTHQGLFDRHPVNQFGNRIQRATINGKTEPCLTNAPTSLASPPIHRSD